MVGSRRSSSSRLDVGDDDAPAGVEHRRVTATPEPAGAAADDRARAISAAHAAYGNRPRRGLPWSACCIRDATDGTDLDQVLLVREVERRTRRDGGEFLRLTLGDRSGQRRRDGLGRRARGIATLAARRRAGAGHRPLRRAPALRRRSSTSARCARPSPAAIELEDLARRPGARRRRRWRPTCAQLIATVQRNRRCARCSSG